MTPAPALILIDWQLAFRDAAFWGERNNPAAEANAARLVAFWRQAEWPVVIVRHDSVSPQSPLRPESPGNALEPFATPSAGDLVVSKAVNSAFIGTRLEAELRQRGISALVFSGVSTDHCVSTTVRMAANLGFEVSLAADACYAFDRTLGGKRVSADAIHEAHLASLDGEFARVADTHILLSELAAAGH